MSLDFQDFVDLNLNFSLPEQFNVLQICHWLEHIEPLPELKAAPQRIAISEKASAAEQYLTCFAHSFHILCELIRLPVFHPPQIIAISTCEKDPLTYQGRLRLPVVDCITLEIYRSLSEFCCALIPWLNRRLLNPNARLDLYRILQLQLFESTTYQVTANKSTIPILKRAHQMGIPFVHIGQGAYQLGWGSKARRLLGSVSDQDAAIGAQLAQRKITTAQILRNAGLPAPTHSLAKSLEELADIADQLGYPLVVKPNDQDRGLGVTVNVTDYNTLEESFVKAQTHSLQKEVVIERQIAGTCHRLLIVNGKLLYAVTRHPMSLWGDGKTSIEVLLQQEMEKQSCLAPWNRSEIKPLDELALATLSRQGFKPQDVVPLGERIALRPIESTEWGGVDEDVTHIISPENVNIALQAASLLCLNIAGIDIISPDIRQPWFLNGAIINEVNYAPLLGGASISRSYLPTFFSEFIQDQGKIPIIDGGDEATCRHMQADMCTQGLRCYVTSENTTLDHQGKVVHLACVGLRPRLKALVHRRDVDAIVYGRPVRQKPPQRGAW